MVPILAIDDAGYDIECYVDHKSARSIDNIVFENGEFSLYVVERLVIADLAVFRNWVKGLDWTDVLVPSGYYAVTIKGFREQDSNGDIAICGYEVHFKTVDKLVELTGSEGRNSRVFD